MKHYYTLAILLFLLITNAKAQISITSDELLGIGDIVVQGFDNDPDASIIPGEAGEDLLWDFSALMEDNTDTFRFLNPTSTPYWGNFPDANLCMFTGTDSSWVYFNKNTDDLLMVGVATEVDELGLVSSEVDPNEEFLVFPYEYGYQSNETFNYYFNAEVSIPGVDSMKVKRITVKDSEVDAWGSMTVPMGTYEVLRVHEIRDYTDSIWTKVPFFGWQLFSVEESTEERFLWWSDDPEVGYILVNLNIDPETGDVIGSEFMAEPHLVGIQQNVLASNLNIYPNPARDKAYINNPSNTELTYSIYDLSGKHILNGISAPANKTLLDIDRLESGIYFISMNKGTVVITKKLIKH